MTANVGYWNLHLCCDILTWNSAPAGWTQTQRHVLTTTQDCVFWEITCHHKIYVEHLFWTWIICCPSVSRGVFATLPLQEQPSCNSDLPEIGKGACWTWASVNSQVRFEWSADIQTQRQPPHRNQGHVKRELGSCASQISGMWTVYIITHLDSCYLGLDLHGNLFPF